MSEFVEGIRGKLNQTRLMIVKEAWKKMSYGSDVSIDGFRKFYQQANVSESFESMMKEMDTNTDGFI